MGKNIYISACMNQSLRSNAEQLWCHSPLERDRQEQLLSESIPALAIYSNYDIPIASLYHLFTATHMQKKWGNWCNLDHFERKWMSQLCCLFSSAEATAAAAAAVFLCKTANCHYPTVSHCSSPLNPFFNRLRQIHTERRR